VAEHLDRPQRLPPLLGAERQHLTDGAARPLLLVDIDGVLHPFGALARPEGFVEYGLDVVPGDDPVWLAAQHGEWLRELARDFEMAWVTGWAQDPNLLCPLLGIDPMPRVPMPEIPFDPELKVGRVASFVGDRSVAWVDDALGPSARQWASVRAAPTLLVDVDPAVGLTEHHVMEVRGWRARLDSPS
jgi:hypothetical protein